MQFSLLNAIFKVNIALFTTHTLQFEYEYALFTTLKLDTCWHFFHGYFSLSSTVHNHAMRQSCRNDLYMILKNTLRNGLGSIRYQGAKLWNELPREVRTSASRFIFNKELQKYLLEIM